MALAAASPRSGCPSSSAPERPSAASQSHGEAKRRPSELKGMSCLHIFHFKSPSFQEEVVAGRHAAHLTKISFDSVAVPRRSTASFVWTPHSLDSLERGRGTRMSTLSLESPETISKAKPCAKEGTTAIACGAATTQSVDCLARAFPHTGCKNSGLMQSLEFVFSLYSPQLHQILKHRISNNVLPRYDSHPIRTWSTAAAKRRRGRSTR